MQAPTDIQENKRFRVDILQKAENDIKLQEVLKKKCVEDKIFLFNTFFWTYDPRLAYPHLPFILYPKQVELVRELDNCLLRSRLGEQVNLLLDKPRDVGATFTVLGWGLAEWMFDEFSFRVGSRKEDYVDKKGEPDTLFYKFDYILERLPEWLLPVGFDLNKHRASMILRHPLNDNVISGESANPNFGRGGRKSATLFDELAFWDWARSSWESSGESTNFRICMSTPPESGRDSHFYKLRIGKRGTVKLFNFEWTDVPNRDEAWYKKKQDSKSEEEFAREVMKSYEGTTEGKVYAKDVSLMTLSDVEYKGGIPLMCAWDFGLDTVSLLWIQKDPNTRWIKIIDAYWNSNKSIDFYVPFITGIIKSGSGHHYNDYELEMIKRHKSWTPEITHYGDPSVNQRHLSRGESTRTVLEDDHDIYIQSKDWSGRKWTDLRNITRKLFRRIEVNEKRCDYFISCMRNAKYPKLREGSQAMNEPLKPVHDWTSHFRSTLEYFADNEDEIVDSGSMAITNTHDTFEDLHNAI